MKALWKWWKQGGYNTYPGVLLSFSTTVLLMTLTVLLVGQLFLQPRGSSPSPLFSKSEEALWHSQLDCYQARLDCSRIQWLLKHELTGEWPDDFDDTDLGLETTATEWSAHMSRFDAWYDDAIERKFNGGKPLTNWERAERDAFRKRFWQRRPIQD